jgi:hypothetical protein
MLVWYFLKRCTNLKLPKLPPNAEMTKKIAEITDKGTKITSGYVRLRVSIHHLSNFIKIGVDLKKLWQ